jgi:hypothetical protein
MVFGQKMNGENFVVVKPGYPMWTTPSGDLENFKFYPSPLKKIAKNTKNSTSSD